MTQRDEVQPPWLTATVVLAGLGGGLLLTWWTVVAFIGGRLWPLPWEVDGGIGFGLFWLLVVDPIAMTLLYWGITVLLMPVVAVTSRQHRSDGSGKLP